MENASVLGISLGTRQCGFAVVQHGTLIDWKVKNYGSRWSANKRMRILGSIEKMVQRYGIKKISCKMPGHIRNLMIDSLKEGIDQFCERSDVTLCFVSLEDLKHDNGPEVRNREMLVGTMAAMFTELTPIFLKHTKRKNSYYIKIFEAVGAAHHRCRQRYT